MLNVDEPSPKQSKNCSSNFSTTRLRPSSFFSSSSLPDSDFLVRKTDNRVDSPRAPIDTGATQVIIVMKAAAEHPAPAPAGSGADGGDEAADQQNATWS